MPLKLRQLPLLVRIYIETFRRHTHDTLCLDPTTFHASALTPILSTVSTSNMQTNLASLTALNNRYYKATTGATASTWIKDKAASVNLPFNAVSSEANLQSNSISQRMDAPT